MSAIPSLEEFAPAEELSRHAQHLIDFARHRRLPKSMTKQDIVNQFRVVFEMIGGVPRLALWADQNPDLFYQHYAKLLPAVLKQQLEMVLPQEDADPRTLTTAQLKDAIIIELRKEQISETG